MTSNKAAVSGPARMARAAVYLSETTRVAGRMPHVDDGAHAGKW